MKHPLDDAELDSIAANVAHHEPDEDMPRLIAALRESRAQVASVRALADRYARGRGGPAAARILAALDVVVEPRHMKEG